MDALVQQLDHEVGRQLAHRHDGYNYTDSITTSVTIRVTPGPADYMVSWAVLWAGFVIVSVVAFWQVLREHRLLTSRSQPDDVEQASSGANTDGEGVSPADITRSMFRKLLLLATVTRVLLMPIEIFSNPIWLQFVGDTLPEMIYASAWSLLVTFFVQLVGIATGTGTNTSPGMVITTTAYVVYLVLIVLQLYNSVASVLLYALLCCIYAALFGVVVYFCPRLISLLQPSLTRHSGLAIRLSICTLLCIAVFGAHTVGFARKVVAPPKQVYWWWTYGALELIPAAIFLAIMHPNTTKADRSALLSPVGESTARKAGNMRRSESGSSNVGHPRRAGETTALLKPNTTAGYGGASVDSSTA